VPPRKRAGAAAAPTAARAWAAPEARVRSASSYVARGTRAGGMRRAVLLRGRRRAACRRRCLRTRAPRVTRGLRRGSAAVTRASWDRSAPPPATEPRSPCPSARSTTRPPRRTSC
jgi:hypothetical protein